MDNRVICILVLLIQFYRLMDAYICRPDMEGIICENEVCTVECTTNESIIIVSASYGRTTKTACPNRSTGNTNCSAPTAKQIISEECKNKTSCLVKASNNIFGDPCRGINKYVNLTYQCEENISTEKQDLPTSASKMTGLIIGIVIVCVIIVLGLCLLLYKRLKVTGTDSEIAPGSISKPPSSPPRTNKTTILFEANVYEQFKSDDTDHLYSDLTCAQTENVYHGIPNRREYINTKPYFIY